MQFGSAVGGGEISLNEHLHINSHRQHVLFGGTKVLQHTRDKAAWIRTPDGGSGAAYRCEGVMFDAGVLCLCCTVCC
jgi:hypothetical protein